MGGGTRVARTIEKDCGKAVTTRTFEKKPHLPVVRFVTVLARIFAPDPSPCSPGLLCAVFASQGRNGFNEASSPWNRLDRFRAAKEKR